MKKMLIVFIFFIAGCVNSSQGMEKAKLASESKIQSVVAMFRLSDDPLNGNSAKSYIISLRNTSRSDLTKCKLFINNAYSAELKNLKYTTFLATKNLSNNMLAPGQKIDFIFSHDVDNFRAFKTDEGLFLKPDVIPSNLKLTCSEGAAEWILPK